MWRPCANGSNRRVGTAWSYDLAQQSLSNWLTICKLALWSENFLLAIMTRLNALVFYCNASILIEKKAVGHVTWSHDLAQQSLLRQVQQCLLCQAQQSLPNWPTVCTLALWLEKWLLAIMTRINALIFYCDLVT